MRLNPQIRFGVCILVTTLAFVAASGGIAHPVRAQSSDPAQICTTILQAASQVTQDQCANTDRNEACYGNNAVTAAYQPSVDPAAYPFLTAGDIVPVSTLQTIQTHPLNVNDKTWGIALLKLQVDLPDTNPGQNVTFLLIGDSQINNTSGNMRAFYFSTGLGQLTCNSAPDSGLMVRVPHGLKVSFQANGVQVSLASTAILRAVPHQEMTVTLIEGHGLITAHGVTQILPAGSEITIPLGGSNGLESAGPPSAAHAVAYDVTFDQLINVTDHIALQYAEKHGLPTPSSLFIALPGSPSILGSSNPGTSSGSGIPTGGNPIVSVPVGITSSSGTGTTGIPIVSSSGNGDNNGNNNGDNNGEGGNKPPKPPKPPDQPKPPKPPKGH